MSAIIFPSRLDVVVNSTGPYPCDLRITQPTVTIHALGAAMIPDPEWFAIDAAGHFHAVDQRSPNGQWFPTLNSDIKHASDCTEDYCDYFCEDPAYACQICGEVIEPRFVSDRETIRHETGPPTWDATVYGWAPLTAEHVSVRFTSNDTRGARFGIAVPVEWQCESGRLPRTDLVGIGTLGNTHALRLSKGPST